MGYDRIVYGDHGPYVELSPEHVCWPTFHDGFVQKPEISFYDELWTCDGSTMLYAQKRPVLNKPNPPCGPFAVQNNRREGYANYLGGKYYLSAEADTIAVRCVRLVGRRRRKRGKAGEAGPPQEESAGTDAEDGQDSYAAGWAEPGVPWGEAGWAGAAWAWSEAPWDSAGEWPTSAPSDQPGAQRRWVQKPDLHRLEPAPSDLHSEAGAEG